LKGTSLVLTVIMPVYNAMPFVDEAVRSILSQDILDLEILALDGGSTDGSVDFLRSVEDPRLKVVAFEKLGLGATLKYGLEACTTPLFARMDADDRCAPSRLRKQLAFLEDHPEVGMVGTQFQYIGISGSGALSPEMPCDHDNITRGLYDKKLTLVHGSLVGRTQTVLRAGGYRVRGMGEDWDMFLRVSERTRLANLPERLYEWRLHDQNAELPHLMDQQIGIDFACECARRRSEGIPEIDFDEFVADLGRQSLVRRLMKRADVYSLAQYRIALTTIAGNRRAQGYARLAYSAACSPSRTFRRVRRALAARSARGSATDDSDGSGG
jgi:glycosyltransferase involved in cell wall biosynthesis